MRFPSSESFVPSLFDPIVLFDAPERMPIPLPLGSGVNRLTEVPIRLPEIRLSLVPVFSRRIPQSVLPEITFMLLVAVPIEPMMLLLAPWERCIPMMLGIGAVPSLFVPM